jgi:hypothetical protein
VDLAPISTAKGTNRLLSSPGPSFPEIYGCPASSGTSGPWCVLLPRLFSGACNYVHRLHLLIGTSRKDRPRHRRRQPADLDVVVEGCCVDIVVVVVLAIFFHRFCSGVLLPIQFSGPLLVAGLGVARRFGRAPQFLYLVQLVLVDAIIRLFLGLWSAFPKSQPILLFLRRGWGCEEQADGGLEVVGIAGDGPEEDDPAPREDPFCGGGQADEAVAIGA